MSKQMWKMGKLDVFFMTFKGPPEPSRTNNLSTKWKGAITSTSMFMILWHYHFVAGSCWFKTYFVRISSAKLHGFVGGDWRALGLCWPCGFCGGDDRKVFKAFKILKPALVQKKTRWPLLRSSLSVYFCWTILYETRLPDAQDAKMWDMQGLLERF